MSDQNKRRFWQIHLSTAIVLMFITGGLVWLNVRPPTIQRTPTHSICRWSGWPLAYGAELFPDIRDDELIKLSEPPLVSKILIGGINIAIGFVLVFTTAAVLENAIRRRENRRHEREG